MKAKKPDLTRGKFLADPEVAEFTKFFRQYLHSKQFSHSYFHFDSGREWECSSLIDAASKYSWPVDQAFRGTLGLAKSVQMPDDFESNTNVLTNLQQRLREAYCEGDATALEEVGKEIFVWGGTLKDNPATLAALNQQPGGLKAYLTFCYISFGAGEALNSTVFEKRGLLCNAGFTKIYSLQFSAFVIYDSRVAAALSLFVMLYCAATGKASVPAGLSFPCMPARTYKRKKMPPRQPLRRSASASVSPGQKWMFPRCGNDHARHIDANLRANWLLSSAIADDPSPHRNQFSTSYGLAALRALEGALFMIGYDLENAVMPPGVGWC